MKYKYISNSKFEFLRDRKPVIDSIYTAEREYKDKIYLKELQGWYKKENFEVVE